MISIQYNSGDKLSSVCYTLSADKTDSQSFIVKGWKYKLINMYQFDKR